MTESSINAKMCLGPMHEGELNKVADRVPNEMGRKIDRRYYQVRTLFSFPGGKSVITPILFFDLDPVYRCTRSLVATRCNLEEDISKGQSDRCPCTCSPGGRNTANFLKMVTEVRLR